MFDYTEYVFEEGESADAVTKSMTDDGWELYLTTMFKEDRKVKAITFRRLSA